MYTVYKWIHVQLCFQFSFIALLGFMFEVILKLHIVNNNFLFFNDMEKEMATHSSISCLEKPHEWRRLAGNSTQGCKELDTNWTMNLTTEQ